MYTICTYTLSKLLLITVLIDCPTVTGNFTLTFSMMVILQTHCSFDIDIGEPEADRYPLNRQSSQSLIIYHSDNVSRLILSNNRGY